MLVIPSSYSIHQVLDIPLRMEVHPDHRTNHHHRVSDSYAALHQGTSNRPALYQAVHGRAELSNHVASGLILSNCICMEVNNPSSSLAKSHVPLSRMQM